MAKKAQGALIAPLRLFALLLLPMHACHAQLTDAQVERLKRESPQVVPAPPIVEFEGLQTYEECVERAKALGLTGGPALLSVCALRAPIGEAKLCERKLTAAEAAAGKVVRVLVDCDTQKDVQVWRRSDPPDPNYIDIPKGWPTSVGVSLRRFTWRVHTRSRNQEKSGWLQPDLAEGSSDYVVCAARVTRISDIGNGNKWMANFTALNPNVNGSRANMSVRYSLKPRNWRTDSDLASQTFLFEVYYLKESSWKAMWEELQSPTVKPSVMKMFWDNNIKCTNWSAGNDAFAPTQPKQPKSEPVNPFAMQPPSSVWVTGEVRCNNGDANFGAFVRHSADGDSCEAAKSEIRNYFAATDRCRYQQDRTYPSWSSYPGITWIRTGNCK